MGQDAEFSAQRRKNNSRPGVGAYAALDLGSNNCRLLVAERGRSGFRTIDSFSRIVRLGEGVATNGRLSPAAMERALGALHACAAKMRRWPLIAQRCIATQACRAADNAQAFLARVAEETGLYFSVITPREEAELSVLGCKSLIDPAAEAVLIVDVGGGSTELSWVDARGQLAAWTSLPVGVVALAEKYGDAADGAEIYASAVDAIRQTMASFRGASALQPIFQRGAGQLIGTSGTVTSLAGVHLKLQRYRRDLVDGIWLDVDSARDAAARLRALGREGRARHGCIGPDRADLVVPGAAILEALFAEWPVHRVRVADRGLREGMLLTLMGHA